MATRFDPECPIVTSVLLCRVSREEQQHVSERLEYLVGANMNGLDGFLSATLEKDVRGDAVIVFSQWQSQNHHAAMLKEPTVRECLRDIGLISKSVDTQVYETVKIFERISRGRVSVGLSGHEATANLQ